MDKFTNGKPRIATKEECAAPWGGGKNGKYFRCSLCGYKFKAGDYWRWQYTGGAGAGCNLTLCSSCDEGDVIQKAIDLEKEWKDVANGKFWRYTRNT